MSKKDQIVYIDESALFSEEVAALLASVIQSSPAAPDVLYIEPEDIRPVARLLPRNKK